ncbi:MAG: hypothetical protein K8S98_03135 [Planctomycetes bacterium]|nr:hypothetical protein [Planctomycetota bacterium]
MVLGAVFGLVGVALAVEKFLPAPVAAIAASAHQMGLGGDVLAVGGFLLIAIGSLVKSASRAAARPSDDALLLEQVASDLIVVKDGLEQARQSTQIVHDDVRMVQSSVQALAETQSAMPQGGINGEDAIFRLAASLDQLGARMEQRMKAQYGEMQSSLDELGDVVTSMRRHIDEMLESQPMQASAHPPVPAVPVEAPRAPLPLSSVEAPVHVPLGLLDQLDDALAPVAQAMPTQAMPRGAAMQAQPSVPMTTPAPMSVPMRDDTDEKLTELRALLTDERLRAALEQMRRPS